MFDVWNRKQAGKGATPATQTISNNNNGRGNNSNNPAQRLVEDCGATRCVSLAGRRAHFEFFVGEVVCKALCIVNAWNNGTG